MPGSDALLDVEIDALLSEFDGDARAVIGALLHDLAVLARDAEADTSRGYVRGRGPFSRRGLRVTATDPG